MLAHYRARKQAGACEVIREAMARGTVRVLYQLQMNTNIHESISDELALHQPLR